MWDRCFNIGSALIYSSCRSGFSALGLSPGGGGCGRSRPPPGLRAARSPGGRGGGEEGGAGESRAESGTSPSLSPTPIDNSLDQKLILFVQFIDQPKMAPGAAAATAAPGVGPHPGRPPGPAPPPLPPPPRDRGGGGPGGPRGARVSGKRAAVAAAAQPREGAAARRRRLAARPAPPARRIPGESLWGVAVGGEAPASPRGAATAAGAAELGLVALWCRRLRGGSERPPAATRPGSGQAGGWPGGRPGVRAPLPRPARAPAAAPSCQRAGPRRRSGIRRWAPSADPRVCLCPGRRSGATRRPRNVSAPLCAYTSGVGRLLRGQGSG